MAKPVILVVDDEDASLKALAGSLITVGRITGVVPSAAPERRLRS